MLKSGTKRNFTYFSKSKKPVVLTAAVICVMIASTCITAKTQAAGGFSVRAIIPDNQINKKQTYFDLRMQPGAQQTLEIVIDNTQGGELLAEVRVNPASTGRNGLIVYTQPDIRDENMTLSISDVAQLERERVTVPAGGKETVSIALKMPQEPFSGTVLGGITVTGAEPDSVTRASEGVSLKNKVTYVIALKLTESDAEEAPDFALKKISAELVNFKPSVVAAVQNKSARIVKDMSIRAQVYQKDSETPLRELELDDVEMAPQSSGDFVIDWQNKPVSRGTYRLKMTAEYNGRIWEWDESFIIGGEANDINSGAVGLIRHNTWYYVGLGGLAMVLVWYAAYRAGRRKRKSEGLSS